MSVAFVRGLLMRDGETDECPTSFSPMELVTLPGLQLIIRGIAIKTRATNCEKKPVPYIPYVIYNRIE